MHVKVKARPTLDDSGKIDIFEYRPEILKPFKQIDVASFTMTTRNHDLINPPIEKLILDGMKLETIRQNEILSYKKLFSNFTEPEILYGPRPEWASYDWTSADLAKLSIALKNYLQDSNKK